MSLLGLLNIAVGKLVREQAWNRWSFALPSHLALGVVKCSTLMEKKKDKGIEMLLQITRKIKYINMLKYLSTSQFCI